MMQKGPPSKHKHSSKKCLALTSLPLPKICHRIMKISDSSSSKKETVPSGVSSIIPFPKEKLHLVLLKKYLSPSREASWTPSPSHTRHCLASPARSESHEAWALPSTMSPQGASSTADNQAAQLPLPTSDSGPLLAQPGETVTPTPSPLTHGTDEPPVDTEHQ